MQKYLASTDYIDWKTAAVYEQALGLSNELVDPLLIAKKCFEFVRDEIKHSGDYSLNPVTCKASDVLEHGTGYCYAKSHLLAALLRANGIPAGLCYQRLTVTDVPPFALHGLNAIFLDGIGWYRVDARGNKPGVNSVFCPPKEQLAFPIKIIGEADLPEIWAEPLSVVVNALTEFKTCYQLGNSLPDVEIITF